MDSYFTTILFLEKLLDEDMYGTGKIIKFRIPALSHLTTGKETKKAQMSYSEQSERDNFKVYLFRWYSQNPVIPASSKLGKDPINECKGWSDEDATYIDVPRPQIVKS